MTEFIKSVERDQSTGKVTIVLTEKGRSALAHILEEARIPHTNQMPTSWEQLQSFTEELSRAIE